MGAAVYFWGAHCVRFVGHHLGPTAIGWWLLSLAADLETTGHNLVMQNDRRQ